MKKENLFLGSGAVGAIIIPQYAAAVSPHFLSNLFPAVSRSVPCCSGVCGACGGLCLTGISAAAWLCICAGRKHFTAKI